MIHVRCAHCGRDWDVGNHLAGLTMICKNCSERIAVAPTSPEKPTTIIPAAAPCPPVPSFNNQRSFPPPVHKLPDSEPLTWAEDYVEASLKVGRTVTQIEEHLVKRGLNQAAAAELVADVLGKRVRAKFGPMEREDRALLLHRVLAVSVAAVYIALTVWHASAFRFPEIIVIRTIGVTVLALALICFSNYRWSGVFARIRRWAGWLVLLFILFRRIALILETMS